MSLRLADEAATLAAGARLADPVRAAVPECERGLHLHLSGELGAGKTTLARGLLRALGVTGPVRSPTYTLVEPYPLPGLEVFHLDLYRLSDPQELELLGIRDEFRAGVLCLVEWPERAAGWLPAASLELRLAHAGEGRCLRWRALDAAGDALAAALAAASS